MEAWEMTLEHYKQSREAGIRFRYPDILEEEITYCLRNSEATWREAIEQALDLHRIPDKVIDNYLLRYGHRSIRVFRKMPGFEQYMPA